MISRLLDLDQGRSRFSWAKSRSTGSLDGSVTRGEGVWILHCQCISFRTIPACDESEYSKQWGAERIPPLYRPVQELETRAGSGVSPRLSMSGQDGSGAGGIRRGRTGQARPAEIVRTEFRSRVRTADGREPRTDDPTQVGHLRGLGMGVGEEG